MILVIGGVIALGGAGLVAILRGFGGDFEYDGPTRDTASAKAHRVFVASLSPVPDRIDLGDTTYSMQEVWVERQFHVRNAGVLSTRTDILPTMTLCVRLVPIARNELLARTAIRIEDKRSRPTYEHDSASTVFLASDVGSSIPEQIIVRCDTREKECVVQLRRGQDRLSDLTSRSIAFRAEAWVAPVAAVGN